MITSLMILGSFSIAIITLLIFILFIIVTKAVSIPFLMAKLKNGTLLFMKKTNGKYELVHGRDRGTIIDAGKYGTFVPNIDAATSLGGVPIYKTFQLIAVPATDQANEAATKLKDADFEPGNTFKETIESAKNQLVLDDADVSALYNYSNAVNPHYLNSRIERRVAEVLRAYRDNLPKLMGYAIIGFILMMGAALGFYIISDALTSGSAATSGDAAGQTVTMLSMPLWRYL